MTSAGNTVTYQNAPYTVTIEQLWWQKQGLMQTATGYGRKLTTQYMLRLPDSPRAYRVYAICFSNCASFYIIRKGTTLFLRDYELESARDTAVESSRFNDPAYRAAERKVAKAERAIRKSVK